MNTSKYTPALLRVLEIAEIEAAKDKMHVAAHHVLIGMLLEGKNSGASALESAGFNVSELRKFHVPPAPVLELVGKFSEGEQEKLKKLGFVRTS